MDIFDPAHYGGVRRPVGEAETLPGWCYTAPEFTSVLRRPGPFALREPAVHRLNNWLLDQVLDGPGRRRAVLDR